MALSNVQWKGMKAIEVMFQTLPDKLGGKRLKEAYKFALMPTKDAMKANIPADRTGKLKYSIDTTIGGAQDLPSLFGVIGPRRKRNVWNMQGWHAHLIEKGTKGHTITAGPGKKLPIFQGGGIVGFVKSFVHPGQPGRFPFKKSMDTTWGAVASRIADKVAEIMRFEIKSINQQYGKVVTRSDL